MKHPIQKIIQDENGVLRFVKNSIVEYLLKNGKIDLNDISMLNFPREDEVQFAQLIGYSLSGFGGLSYVTDQDYEAADAMARNGVGELEARNIYLENLVNELKETLKNGVARLYEKNPDDLMEKWL